MKSDKLKLRIFRRTLNNIMIIWNLEGLEGSEADFSKLKIFLLGKDNNPERMIEFRQINLDDFKNLKNKKGVIDGVIIPQEKNLIDPYKKVKLEFQFDKSKTVIEVKPKGFSEKFLKDNKDKAVFLYAFDSKNKVWRKVEGIEIDGKFALLTTSLLK